MKFSDLFKNDAIDDITYIREMKHIKCGVWHQYDVLLEARGYGWEIMLDRADYVATADFSKVDRVTVSAIGGEERDVTDFYRSNGSCKSTPALSEEKAALGFAGLSCALNNAPVKIVWFNQTRVLRVFTPIGNKELMNRYIETLIRRSFGTADAMKKAKPIPKE